MPRRPRIRRTPLPTGNVSGASPRLRCIGPYVEDAKSGLLIERARAVRQGAGWVSSRLSDGTYDLPTGDPRDD